MLSHFLNSGIMLIQVYVLMAVLHIYLCVDLIYYVEEGKSPNTYLGDIAEDSHLMDDITLKEQKQVTFSQLQKGVSGNSKLFHISKNTGKLYTAQTLDAESLCSYNVECFQMVDIAVKKATTFFKLIEIKVIIKDVNDHQPEFPDKQVNVKFSEGDVMGTKVIIPSAIDRDIGVLNSQITYELKKKKEEAFTLFVSKSVDGTSQLALNLEKKLNREVTSLYQIQIRAKDGGSPPKESMLNIHISVIDVNDNFPVFSQNVYNVSIKNKPDAALPVTTLSAKDLDFGANGKIFYNFSPKTSDIAKAHFDLNSKTGEIFLVKKFTTGQKLKSKLYVKASDGGNPPLSSLAMVQVNVINEQNNAPVIDINFVSASRENTVDISEDIKVGSFIAYVKVTDQDADQNGKVTCSLNHDKFQLQSLDTKKYQVIVKKPVDREIGDHHDIIIICLDKGNPPLQSKSKFSVQVFDVNDEQPQFSKQSFKFFIDENQRSKIPVGTINATDPDLGLGGKLSFSLLPTNKQFVPFRIAEKGLISSIMSLDHEFQDTYKFQVFVKDKGTPSLNNTVNVIVKVRDENDNAPYFTFPSVNPYNMHITYYSHYTKNITQIKASDSDSQENAFLKYEIIRGNSKQIFSINQYTGLLSSTHVLSQQDAGSYELEFLVKDSGSPVLSARTTVYLTLTVSNKTSEMLNTVNIKKDNKIHLTSAIIIVSVAVTIAVIITASISVCILRCCNPRSVPVVEGSYVSGQRHLVSPPYPANPWSNVGVSATNADMRRNSQPPTPQMQSHPYSSTQQMLSSSTSSHQPAADSISQVSIYLFVILVHFYLK